MSRFKPTPIDAILARYGLKRIDVMKVMDVSSTAIAYWNTGMNRPSPETAIAMEQKLNIPRWELRPDLWPKPTTTSAIIDEALQRTRRRTAA